MNIGIEFQKFRKKLLEKSSEIENVSYALQKEYNIGMAYSSGGQSSSSSGSSNSSSGSASGSRGSYNKN
ncbi:MAG: hypothetical protein NT120_01935 [Candidatus Aenigmarchaeota archaeon]|nr:hypothetical protein [Candidatus Aenigmarchaeota archaeon]